MSSSLDTCKESGHKRDDISFCASENLYLRKVSSSGKSPPETRTSGNTYLRKSVNLESRTSGNPYLWKSVPPEIRTLREFMGRMRRVGAVQCSAPTYFLKKTILLRASFFCQYDLACATMNICYCSTSNNPTLQTSTSCFVYNIHVQLDT